MASHGCQYRCSPNCGIRPTVTLSLISNDSLSSSASDTFHSIPSFLIVVPVPVQMSSMPRNWSTRPLARSWTTPSMTWPLYNYHRFCSVLDLPPLLGEPNAPLSLWIPFGSAWLVPKALGCWGGTQSNLCTLFHSQPQIKMLSHWKPYATLHSCHSQSCCCP